MTTSQLEGLVLKLHRQNGAGRCGVALARSVLDAQFGIHVTEAEAIEEIGSYAFYQQRPVSESDIRMYLPDRKLTLEEISPQERKLVLVKKYGLPPKQMATYLRSKAGQELTILCSRQGSLESLGKIVRSSLPNPIFPVLHQIEVDPITRTNEGHYIMFLGTYPTRSGQRVQIFDPAFSRRVGGIKTFKVERFDQTWLNHGFNERWFLVAYKTGTELPIRLSGKYL